jgi:hypothetical protein
MNDDARQDLSKRDVKHAVKEALDELLGLGEVRMAARFQGGTVVIRPAKADTQEKVIPIDVLFHKITMVRDRLRVLEQRINSHARLSDEDKVELQQYVTRAYGSLTSFNVLFRDRADWFMGSGGAGQDD